MNGAARLHVNGIVQGVGFRPFVYNLAQRMGLSGWVQNTSAGVDIEIEGPGEILNEFIGRLRAESPPLARIDEIVVTFASARSRSGFEIRESASLPEQFQPISPDTATCPDCLTELFDPGNRRYRYPFINCTNCGPRFTIIKDIPYDRPLTTMAPFAMCPDCAREYNDPSDRRFHAQPVACHVCGPRVWLETIPSAASGSRPEGEAALQGARELLANGKIVAIKGLGGFHLACDALNPQAVAELRRRKLRVDKPFAVMLRDMDEAVRQCELTSEDSLLLQSTARPIVLVERSSKCLIAPEVAPGVNRLGIMLPYTPLHYLLMEPSGGFSAALVMTSGNQSEEPIATDNGEARIRLAVLADALLLHDRDIHMRCDDSVMLAVPDESTRESAPSGSSGERASYPVRRSRGYAPFPLRLPWLADPVLAVGAELKNTFCLTNRNYAFMSQHIGDLQNYETLRSFEAGISHFEGLFRSTPKALAHDLHPDYLATRYALRRSESSGLPALGIQHHHAHVASCMAEHGLDGSFRVIGAALDGTGYGLDGAIWGGEFLVADYLDFERPFHLGYMPLPGGDAAIKQPARLALALLWSLGIEWADDLPPVHHLGRSQAGVLLAQFERGLNSPPTSSMGRLFDAAASLAGVRHQVNYEAQASIEFEALVAPDERDAYPFEVDETGIQLRAGIDRLLDDVRRRTPSPTIAARFHNGVSALVLAVVRRINLSTGIRQVVLSGGVWQNITLLRRTLSLLRAQDFQVYIHHDVPTNDGGLALGQAAIAASRIRAGYVPRSPRSDPADT